MFETIKLDKSYNLKLTMKGIKEIENTLKMPLTDIMTGLQGLSLEQWEIILMALIRPEFPDITMDFVDEMIEKYCDIPYMYTKITNALTESTILNMSPKKAITPAVEVIAEEQP